MTHRKSWTLAIGLLLGTLIGCGLQKGETLFTAGPTSSPTLGTAPSDGQYAVYTASSPNPTATFHLNQGDPLGFDRDADGHIDAIAGTNHVHLGVLTVQAYWKKQ